MPIYATIIRTIFGVIFVLAGVVHLIQGRVDPRGYAVFADTALLPWLAELWRGFVMDNIGWLTVLLAVFQIACGLGLACRRTQRPAAWGVLAFLLFITVVGYGFPAATALEDFLKNRLVTIVMALLVLPLLPRGNAASFRSRRA